MAHPNQSEIDLLQQTRGFDEDQMLHARAIYGEIINARMSPQDTELGKHGQMGYRARVGAPHQWWEANCNSYVQASEAYPNSKKFNTICLLADILLGGKALL